MKYTLIIHCEHCGKKGQGFLREAMHGNAIQVPNGWGWRTWPSGQDTVVCSKSCGSEVEKKMGRHSIIVPTLPPLVRARAN